MKKKLQELEYPELLRVEKIEEPSLPKIAEMLNIVKALETKTQSQSDISECEMLKNALIEVAGQVWRFKSRLGVLEKTIEARQWKGLDSVVRSILSSLLQAGLELKDHTGEAICGGEAWTIVSWETVEGIETTRVIETVRPTLYYNNELIQPAEVIAGKPATLN